MSANASNLHIYTLYDLPIGAYHHYCSQLSNALAAHPEVASVTLTAVFSERQRADVDPEELALVDSGVKMLILGPGGGSKFSRYWRFFRNLALHFAQLKNDGQTLLHLHTATSLNALDLLLLWGYKIKGIPVVRTIHELTAAERSAQPTRFQQWFGHYLLRLSDGVIVHDALTGQRVRSLLNDAAKPIATIAHGHYLMFRRFLPDASQRRAIGSGDQPVLLFLGIKRHKGIEVFLEAMKRLQEQNVAVKAVIVGRINHGDEDLIEFIKPLRNIELDATYLPNSELWRVYDQADIVMMPYVKGTTSGAVHLAYAFERPVIVSDIECFRDIVRDGETGLVVPSNDSEALVNAIKQLSADPQRCRDMGQAGLKQVSSAAYDWSLIANATVGLYRQVLAAAN